ncbi:hypothetical protein NIES4101_53840 [Calothrix sp. NIES-4101]|nr:hypothetical protein NIES4101_53840 [Calothrix sp. NIES-4101]
MRTWLLYRDRATYNFYDLPDGDWKSEPDIGFWYDELTNMPCLALRNMRNGFYWRGYVAYNPEHFSPTRDRSKISVHGGISFIGPMEVYPTVLPEEIQDKTWIGFDCRELCHGDTPRWQDSRQVAPGDYCRGEYRNLDFVQEECGRLAVQLAKMRLEMLLPA